MTPRFPTTKAPTHTVVTLNNYYIRLTSAGVHGFHAYIESRFHAYVESTSHLLRMPHGAVSMQNYDHLRHIGATRSDVRALYGVPLLQSEAGVSTSLARKYLNELIGADRDTVASLAPVIAENLADAEDLAGTDQPDHQEDHNTTGSAIAAFLSVVITMAAIVTGLIAGFTAGVAVLLLAALPVSWVLISTIRANRRFWKSQVDPIVEALSYIEDEITLIDAAAVPELLMTHNKLAVAELSICVEHADTALIEHRNTLDEIWRHYENLTTQLAHFDECAGTATRSEENAAISAAAEAIRTRTDALLEQIDQHDAHLQQVKKQRQQLERQAREDVTEITSQYARESIQRIAEDLGAPAGTPIDNINPAGK